MSLVAPEKLNNTRIANHYSTTQFPDEVQRYLYTETECGAMLGLIDQVNLSVFPCSFLLSRPKDGNKCRITLKLSHPNGNDNNFTLKFPTIDSIVNSIKALHSDPRIYKIDIARAFQNLRVNPVDAVKLGISWKGKFYLDLNITFSDTIVYIMQKRA